MNVAASQRHREHRSRNAVTSSTMQCDPSDRDRDLACCWLKQKIVSDFPDFNGVSIPVKHARVLRWHTRHGHLQVRCLTRGL